MPKRTVTKTERRWAAIEEPYQVPGRPRIAGDLELADRGVRRSDWAYEVNKWAGRYHIVRVTLSYTLPAGRGRI